jgi:23S rRNA (cytosine1962-C5)-methyltransferase
MHTSFAERLSASLEWRQRPSKPVVDAGAERWFHGFVEGPPAVVVDRYADALVGFCFEDANADELAGELASWCAERAPEIRTLLWKVRAGSDDARRGHWLRGGGALAPREILEDGVRYAIDLRLQSDASFYLDTRNLRQWLHREAAGRTVLNTFAYTGSLGVAAAAGGATRVVQVDRSPRFLELARRSMELNRLTVGRGDLQPTDFFVAASRMRRENRLFDLVIVDPPFFADTGPGGARGRVDLQTGLQALIGKVRPLVAHEGRLVVVNNAVFVSGEAFLAQLAEMCADGYLELEETIVVPPDCVGRAGSVGSDPVWPSDPAPFAHPTKIAVLRARRKDSRRT